MESLNVEKLGPRPSHGWTPARRNAATGRALHSGSEERQGMMVACLEEIAYHLGWITAEDVGANAGPMKMNDYGGYLLRMLEQEAKSDEVHCHGHSRSDRRRATCFPRRARLFPRDLSTAKVSRGRKCRGLRTGQPFSSQRGSVRGLHAQLQRPRQIGSLIEGEIYDVAVDIRRGSPHFGQWVGVWLSAENFRQLTSRPDSLMDSV